MSELQRQQQIFVLMVIYGILSQFVNPSWLQTFLMRVILYELILTGFWLHRNAMNDEYNFATGFATVQAAAVLLEAAQYLNTKQKLQLFVRMKKSE